MSCCGICDRVAQIVLPLRSVEYLRKAYDGGDLWQRRVFLVGVTCGMLLYGWGGEILFEVHSKGTKCHHGW